MSDIYSGITSKLDLKMATTSTTMTTVKKNPIKHSPPCFS